MNFKLKALVAAAVVATTMSGAANAIEVSSNGEMFLVAFDSVSNNSYIKALGVSALAFDGSSDYSAALTGDANWTSFSSAATFNAANVSYSVLGYSVGATSFSSIMRTTASSATVVGGTNGAWDLLNSDVSGAGGGLNTWMSNGPLGNATVTGTSSRFIAASVGDATAAQIGNVWENQMPTIVNTSAALGANDSFYTITREQSSGRGSSAKQVIVSSLLGNWNLSAAGYLTYLSASTAPVPEADSAAMLLAGLGLMGFVARRRSKQA
jgi:hypothetical protein